MIKPKFLIFISLIFVANSIFEQNQKVDNLVSEGVEFYDQVDGTNERYFNESVALIGAGK